MKLVREVTPQPFDTTHEAMGGSQFYGKAHFLHLLRVERCRTERSKRAFLLMLLDISNLTAEQPVADILKKLNAGLSAAVRETEIRGWYDYQRIVGVIFPEIASLDEASVSLLFRKIHDRLSEKLGEALVGRINVSFHIYPEMNGFLSIDGPFNITLYPELDGKPLARRMAMAVKAAIDYIGSGVALLLFSPLFLAVSAAIKLDSEGPVFFRQTRMGMNGKTFELLKFRSMCTDADCSRHQEYIKKYIGEQKNSAVEPGVYKLSNDSRVTRVGRVLRKTSLDELPQLINVFKGEMSIVGPRPPIPYECELYDIWHRRRLLSCKPGITGLWQVTGRSRTTFDEMVRLDLKYISEWSLWLDLKILLKTPRAVLGGQGAY